MTKYRRRRAHHTESTFLSLYFYLAFRFSVQEMRVIKVPFQAAAQAVFILYELKFCTVHQMQF